jgi:hypothetical protein
MAAAAKRKRKSVMQQPSTAAGAGVSLTSLVPFLPPAWQSYGYIAAALLGLAVPILSQMANRDADA